MFQVSFDYEFDRIKIRTTGRTVWIPGDKKDVLTLESVINQCIANAFGDKEVEYREKAR